MATVQIIMATTMPVADEDTTGIRAYNNIIREVAARENLPVDDLFATMDGRMCEFDRGDRLHLTDEGNALVAAQVTKAIEAYL